MAHLGQSNNRSMIISIIVVVSAFIGYIIGGYWNQTLSGLNADPKNYYGLIFLGGFVFIGVWLIVYKPKPAPNDFAIISILASIFALVNEFYLSKIGYLTYLEGEIIALSFAALGYPLFTGFIFTATEWVSNHIPIPVSENKERLTSLLLVIGLLLLAALILVLEDGLSRFQDVGLLTVAGNILILALLGVLAIYYGLSTSIKQSLTLVIVSAASGALMEILGYASGFWSYYIPRVTVFIIILWSIRLLAIGGGLFLLKRVSNNVISSTAE